MESSTYYCAKRTFVEGCKRHSCLTTRLNENRWPFFLIKEPECVFIHIPKTGGASIRHGFFKGNVEGPVQGKLPAEWSHLFKFAFVRHPLDRLVSAWKMFSEGMQQSVWEQPREFNVGITLSDFMKIVVDESIAYGGKRDKVEVKIRHHTIPQTHPFNCLDQADFRGRFENIAEDFKVVCSKIGISDAELPHWNRTNHDQDYMNYIDDDTLDISKQFYAEDFSQLGYALP